MAAIESERRHYRSRRLCLAFGSWLAFAKNVATRHERQMTEVETAELMLRLAVVLGENGRLEESERLYRDALERQQYLLGEWHETTLSTKHGLAVALRNRAVALPI